MEDIVAIAVELEDGNKRFFLTWGRIQDGVDPTSLELLVLKHSSRFSLGGKPIKASLCESLQEAAHEPYFFEAFFKMCQKTIPFGDHYDVWRTEMNEKMQAGKELYYLGNPDRFQKKARGFGCF